MKTYLILFVIVLFILDAQIVIGQSPNTLEGLHIAGPDDIQQGAPLMLDPMSTPMYDEQFQKINPADFMKIMMSNEYLPEPYIDEQKVVKAFVFRKATEVEKSMMLKMQSGMGMDQEKSALIGTQAIDFNLVDLKGKKYKLSDLKGKVIVLNFWFIECKPCVMEMPELNELVNEFKEKEVVFLAITVNKKDQLKSFLKTTKFNYKVIPNGQEVSDSFGIKGYPTNVVIDQMGIIRYSSTGIGPNNKLNLEREIELLLEN